MLVQSRWSELACAIVFDSNLHTIISTQHVQFHSRESLRCRMRRIIIAIILPLDLIFLAIVSFFLRILCARPNQPVRTDLCLKLISWLLQIVQRCFSRYSKTAAESFLLPCWPSASEFEYPAYRSVAFFTRSPDPLAYASLVDLEAIHKCDTPDIAL